MTFFPAILDKFFSCLITVQMYEDFLRIMCVKAEFIHNLIGNGD